MDYIKIPVATAAMWREQLGHYWFSSSDDGEEEFNNDEIIAICNQLDELLKKK